MDRYEVSTKLHARLFRRSGGSTEPKEKERVIRLAWAATRRSSDAAVSQEGAVDSFNYSHCTDILSLLLRTQAYLG